MSLAFFDPVTALEKIKNKNTLHPTNPTSPTETPLDLTLSALSGMSGTVRNEKNTLQVPQDDLPDLSAVWPQPKSCPICYYWQEVKGECWWRGRCGLDGEAARVGQKCRHKISFN